MGAEGAAAGERYVRYSGAENAPDLIPRLIVTYTAPSQGKDHRDYNAYLPEVPSASGAAATRETGARQGTAVNFALVFVGGAVFGGIVGCLVRLCRDKSKKGHGAKEVTAGREPKTIDSHKIDEEVSRMPPQMT